MAKQRPSDGAEGLVSKAVAAHIEELQVPVLGEEGCQKLTVLLLEVVSLQGQGPERGVALKGGAEALDDRDDLCLLKQDVCEHEGRKRKFIKECVGERGCWQRHGRQANMRVRAW